LLPLGFEAASDEAVVGVDRTIAALGASRLVAGTFHIMSPLSQRGVTVGIDLLDRPQGCFQAGGGQRRDECIGHRGIDVAAADAQAVFASAVDDHVAGAVITGARVAPAVVDAQLTPTAPTAGDA